MGCPYRDALPVPNGMRSFGLMLSLHASVSRGLSPQLFRFKFPVCYPVVFDVRLKFV